MTVTMIQFAVGSVLVIFMWLFNLYKKPKVTAAQVVYKSFIFATVDPFYSRAAVLFYLFQSFALQLASIVPLAVVHTLGNLFTNMSLGKVAVSFTHTIKAMEPFFSVLLSAAFLGEVYISYVSYVYFHKHIIC